MIGKSGSGFIDTQLVFILASSIAVIAVDLGLLVATWHYPQWAPQVMPRGSIPFSYAHLGLLGSVARIVLGGYT